MQNTSSQTQLVLQVSNLELVIDGHKIINDMSFSAYEGQFIGVLGPNGAGKSSLLRCLYRFFKPTNGQVSLFNQPLSEYSHNEYAQNVAVVLQEVTEQFNLSLRDVVAMGLTPHKHLFSSLNKQDELDITQAIEQVGLAHKMSEQFGHLSGGEKQRALIAKAIVQKPRLLIMDEPTSHLDVRYQLQIMMLAKSMGITVIASFHDLNLAAAVSDHLLLLNHGNIYKSGSPLEVLQANLLQDVFGVCTEVSHFESEGKKVPHIRYHFGLN